MLPKLLQLLRLRVHGDSLLSRDTAVWATFTAIGVFLVAATEALAWGYVGAFIGGSGTTRYLSALVLGLIAGIAVWILDVSFVVLDLRRHEDEEIMGKTDRSGSAPKNQLLSKLQSPSAGLAMRVGMVLVSLLVSAPYVSQLFFARDIAVVLNKERSDEIQKRREEVVQKHDLRIHRLRQDADSLQKELVNETAGQGPSHRFGRGPTAKTIEKHLHVREAEILQAEASKAGELSTYDSLPPAELAKKYDVVMAGNGIQARNKAMEIVRKQPGYTRTEWTIRALLFGLFVVLVVLKMYQPATARIYYSAFCQDCYILCLKGEFDEVLGQQKNRHWTPISFDQWLKTQYKNHLLLSENTAIQAGIQTNRDLTEKNLREIQLLAESETAPLMADLEQAQVEVETTQEELRAIGSKLKVLEKEIAERQKAIEYVDAAIATPRSAGGFATALGQRETWTNELVNLEKEQTALTLNCDKITVRLVKQQDHVKGIQAAIEARASIITSAQEHINQSRNKALDDIAGAASAG